MNGYMEHLRNNVIRINRDVEHLWNDVVPPNIYIYIDSAAIEATRRGLLRLALIRCEVNLP